MEITSMRKLLVLALAVTSITAHAQRNSAFSPPKWNTATPDPVVSKPYGNPDRGYYVPKTTITGKDSGGAYYNEEGNQVHKTIGHPVFEPAPRAGDKWERFKGIE
jgi:hypothetical protein